MEWYICHRLIQQESSLKKYGNNIKNQLLLVTVQTDYNIGLVVQLVRIPACHAGGREFESRPDR